MQESTIGFIGLAVGAIGVGCAIFNQNKTDKLCKEINYVVNDLSSCDIRDRITDLLIEKAVNRAVDREVGRAIARTSERIVNDVGSKISAEVRRSVSNAYDDTKSSVLNELKNQAQNIDMGRLKREVAEKAKEAVVEKLDASMDSLLADFNQNLQNVSKIYSSVASTLGSNTTRETVLKIM